MKPAVPLYDYQLEWIADKSRYKVARWSRQVGKTFTCSLEIVDDIFQAAAAGRASPWLIMSRAERQAREVMRAHIQAHARAYGLALQAAYDIEIEVEGKKFTADEWSAGGGNIVTALPANPDTARGFPRNIYLDEFALHRDSREIWGAMYPSITRGWRVMVTSTPRGKSGKFYELCSSADGIWSQHTITIEDAVAAGYPADAAELRAGLADELLWRQEYLCQWLDEASAWLSYDLIDAVEHDDAGDPAAFRGGAAYIGVDIGIRRDLWVAWVVELVGDVGWTREISVIAEGTFADRDRELDRLAERYTPIRISIDQTGMGEPVVEAAQRRYGASRVEGVLFTSSRKLELATTLKEWMQDRRLRIPAGDAALRADLHSVQRMAGPTGAPRLVSDGDTDGHSDRTWAAALACAAASGPAWSASYTPVHADDFDLDDAPPGSVAAARRRLEPARVRGGWL